MKFFHLLPRERVLNRDAKIIDLEISAVDRAGLIYDISKCIAERKINISKFQAFAMGSKDALYSIRIEVPNFEEFSELFDTLIQVPSVKSILRKR
jgi:(p)ppGpp synthase/HD superfamily hydrolase